MATQVQYRRGSASQNNAFTGALGEITVDTTNWPLRIHDGATAGGGGNLATVAYVNSQIGSLSADSISNGTSNVKVLSSGGNIDVTVGGVTRGSFSSSGLTVTGNISVSGNLTNTGALSIITGSNGNLTLNAGTGVIVLSSSITNGQANGTGNIGNSTGYFNTVFAKATSAQYADVAEKYVADRNYSPGTVLEIGGDQEVTQSSSLASTKIAGVVSTAPAMIMNATENSPTAVSVALLGRVPCQVVGYVNRGDVLCSSDTPGHACVLPTNLYQPGVVIGKALEDHGSDGPGVIEVLVGRL